MGRNMEIFLIKKKKLAKFFGKKKGEEYLFIPCLILADISTKSFECVALQSNGRFLKPHAQMHK
jgi:hypothetical protein